MNFLSKIKYFILASLGLLIIASPAYAAANPVATRSNELKQKACEARQEVIKNRMTNLVRFTTNMEDVFDKITKRVEEFYQNNIVSQGKTVANYDTLVADIQAKKTTADSALEKARTDAANFTCEVGKAKPALLTFRTDMQAVKAALKDMRTAVKNLIVAVHTVNKTLSTTPKPTEAK